MGDPLTRPPVAAYRESGYDGRLEQVADDAILTTWHLSVLRKPVATNINGPKMITQCNVTIQVPFQS